MRGSLKYLWTMGAVLLLTTTVALAASSTAGGVGESNQGPTTSTDTDNNIGAIEVLGFADCQQYTGLFNVSTAVDSVTQDDITKLVDALRAEREYEDCFMRSGAGAQADPDCPPASNYSYPEKEKQWLKCIGAGEDGNHVLNHLILQWLNATVLQTWEGQADPTSLYAVNFQKSTNTSVKEWRQNVLQTDALRKNICSKRVSYTGRALNTLEGMTDPALFPYRARGFMDVTMLLMINIAGNSRYRRDTCKSEGVSSQDCRKIFGWDVDDFSRITQFLTSNMPNFTTPEGNEFKAEVTRNLTHTASTCECKEKPLEEQGGQAKNEFSFQGEYLLHNQTVGTVRTGAQDGVCVPNVQPTPNAQVACQRALSDQIQQFRDSCLPVIAPVLDEWINHLREAFRPVLDEAEAWKDHLKKYSTA